MAGLEPARLAPLPPQDSVSTNSTTSARTEKLRITLSIRVPKLRDPELFARGGFIMPEAAAESGRDATMGARGWLLLRCYGTHRGHGPEAVGKPRPRTAQLDVPRMQRLLRYCARPILGRASGLGTAARAPGTGTGPACRAEDAVFDRYGSPGPDRAGGRCCLSCPWSSWSSWSAWRRRATPPAPLNPRKPRGPFRLRTSAPARTAFRPPNHRPAGAHP
jgi:hypothetical protein